VRVTLTQATKSGEQKVATVVTGSDGNYVFDHLHTGDRYVYAVDGEFDGGLFAGGAIHLPSDTRKQPVIRSTLRVWPTTTDPKVIQLARDDLFATQHEGSLGVIESVTVFNGSRSAYIGRGAGDGGGGATPTIAFSLPQDVATNANGGPELQLLESDIDLPVLIPSEFGFAATAAIPPGKHKVTFSYRVTGDGGSFDLSRNALYPIVQLTVYAAPPLDVRSNRLTGNGNIRVGDASYGRNSTTEAIDAGDPIQILAVADAGTPAGLIAGAVAIGVLLLLLAIFAARRRRPRRASRRGSGTLPSYVPPPGAPKGKREALVSIAKLDLEFESGSLAEEEWRARRESMKEKLDALPAEIEEEEDVPAVEEGSDE
jgi:hypothetical protein